MHCAVSGSGTACSAGAADMRYFVHYTLCMILVFMIVAQNASMAPSVDEAYVHDGKEPCQAETGWTVQLWQQRVLQVAQGPEVQHVLHARKAGAAGRSVYTRHTCNHALADLRAAMHRPRRGGAGGGRWRRGNGRGSSIMR